jgi:hypothetical protein
MSTVQDCAPEIALRIGFHKGKQEQLQQLLWNFELCMKMRFLFLDIEIEIEIGIEIAFHASLRLRFGRHVSLVTAWILVQGTHSLFVGLLAAAEETVNAFRRAKVVAVLEYLRNNQVFEHDPAQEGHA